MHTLRTLGEWIERQAASDLSVVARDHAGLASSIVSSGDVLVLCSPGVDSVLFNRVLGIREGAPVTRTELAKWIGVYRLANMSRFFVHLYDEPRPEALPIWLAELGLVRYRRSWDKLGRGRAEPLPAPSTPLKVRHARPDDAEAIGKLFVTGFDLPDAAGRIYAGLIGRPGWQVLVASNGSTVAAVGLSFTERGVAYLAGGVTDPQHRGQGAQLALMVERCRAALQAGCRAVVSETGSAAAGDPQHSHHNLQRCGLRVLGTRHNYAPEGLLWQHGRRVNTAPDLPAVR